MPDHRLAQTKRSVVSTKREREYQRRRLEKWQARQEAARIRQRKQRNIALAILAVVVIGLLAIWFVSTRQTTPDPTPTPPAPPTQTDTAPTPPPPPPTQPDTVPAPDPALAEGRIWNVTLHTNLGPITMELDGAAAPQAVAAFTQLAMNGFYENNYCHRLTTAGIFVLQCGDPNATPGGAMNGMGGPDFRFGPVENAPADDLYMTGTVAYARQQNNGYSMGSQFFIVWQDSPIGSDAAGGYSVFGKVTSGMEIVQQVAAAGLASDQVAPATDVIIEKVDVQ